MQRYQRLLVGLGLEAQDDTLLRYASLIARMAHSRHVVFAHAQHDTAAELAEAASSQPGAPPPAPQPPQQALEEALHRHFDGGPQVEVQTEIREGVPLDLLLSLARAQETDLLLVGSRPHERGLLAEHLARKAPCSVLAVPQAAPPAIRRVLVPVDFSAHAADAVDVAAAFARAAGLSELHLLHVYGLPVGTDRYYETFTLSVRQRAEDAYQTFMTDLDLHGLTPVPHFVLGDDVPEAIARAALQREADLLVIGTRGRSPSAALLLGSVAEQLVRQVEVPLVAVKQKGATLKLLDALLERSPFRRS